jgi:hypothetical protein
MNLKGTLVASCLITLVFLSSLAFIPAVSAQSSSGTWYIRVNGSITAAGLSHSGFLGFCQLSGVSSGTGGGCGISVNFHSTTFSFLCKLAVHVTGWTTEASGFVLTSGRAVASAPTKIEAQTCVTLSFPLGTVNSLTGVFVAPIITGIPATPGHFAMEGYGQLPAEANVLVTFVS